MGNNYSIRIDLKEINREYHGIYVCKTRLRGKVPNTNRNIYSKEIITRVIFYNSQSKDIPLCASDFIPHEIS
jgi:hypothetical protein